MPTYEPLDIGVPLKAGSSDLVKLNWELGAIAADFYLPDDDSHLLRVSFDGQCIVRLLDEMALSTEDDPALRHGMIPGWFAYRVDGAPFAQQQSRPWLEIMAPVSHYQFVTGWGCMDVLSSTPPSFSLIARESNAA